MDRRVQAAAGVAGLAAAAAAGAIAGRKTAHRGSNGGAPAPEAEAGPVVEGYCVKERKKILIRNAVQTTMKNGRPAIRGECPDCGAKIFKIGTLAAAGAH